MILTHSQVRSRLNRRQIAAALDTGELRRAGQWFVTRDEADDIVGALRGGMRPTCVTAARHHGLWVPPSAGGHVYGRRRKPMDGLWLHRNVDRWPEADPVASVPLLLEHAVGCLAPLDLGIVADSALRAGLVRDADLACLARSAPRAAAAVLRRTSRLSESGTESKVRLFFTLRGVRVRPQVVIPGVGRVDMLVGDRWIIECDSWAHHTGVLTYEYDRRRDLASTHLGYLTTRLTHRMVFDEWDGTKERLLEVVASRGHRRAPRMLCREGGSACRCGSW